MLFSCGLEFLEQNVSLLIHGDVNMLCNFTQFIHFVVKTLNECGFKIAWVQQLTKLHIKLDQLV